MTVIAPDFQVDKHNPAQPVVQYDQYGHPQPWTEETAVHVLHEILSELRALRELVALAVE